MNANSNESFKNNNQNNNLDDFNDSIAENSFNIENTVNLKTVNSNTISGNILLNKINKNEVIKYNSSDNSEEENNTEEINSRNKTQIINQTTKMTEESDNIKKFNNVADELNNKIKDMLNKKIYGLKK
jgi:hypothetical protein